MKFLTSYGIVLCVCWVFLCFFFISSLLPIPFLSSREWQKSRPAFTVLETLLLVFQMLNFHFSSLEPEEIRNIFVIVQWNVSKFERFYHFNFTFNYECNSRMHPNVRPNTSAFCYCYKHWREMFTRIPQHSVKFFIELY